jgi:hypothetical protein
MCDLMTILPGSMTKYIQMKELETLLAVAIRSELDAVILHTREFSHHTSLCC